MCYQYLCYRQREFPGCMVIGSGRTPRELVACSVLLERLCIFSSGITPCIILFISFTIKTYNFVHAFLIHLFIISPYKNHISILKILLVMVTWLSGCDVSGQTVVIYHVSLQRGTDQKLVYYEFSEWPHVTSPHPHNRTSYQLKEPCYTYIVNPTM